MSQVHDRHGEAAHHVVLLLAAMALLTCYLSGRRALHINPVDALRTE